MSIFFSNCGKKTSTAYFQPDSINILDFGAIPDDGKDDSPAIQAAINHAITGNKSSVLYCPPGVYDLSSGLILANKNNNGEYNYVTLKLIGAVQAYSPNQSIGKVTVFRYKGKGFALALQAARNCVIENIMFEGGFDYSNNFNDDMCQAAENIWVKNYTPRQNASSPSCAVAIDPFHKNIPPPQQYDQLSPYYSNKSIGGSSMILIRGCSFFKQYIAIANGVSGHCMNGDNVRAENCHAQVCYNFWSAGQDQSRANSIENLYAYNIFRLVDGVSIGHGRGTPPTLSHVNFAGISKELFRINTGFSGIMASQCYFENLYTIGTIYANLVSFQQCQFKFRPASEAFYKSPYLLRSNTVVTFRDCSLEYFSNCTDKSPFILLSKKLVLDGGHIEGGLPVPAGITSKGGGHLQNVVLKNVNIKCENDVTTSNLNSLPENFGKIIGESLTNNESDTNSEGIYACYPMEKVDVLLDRASKTISFKSKKVEMYKTGDNLFTESNIPLGDGTSLRAILGFVSKIEGNIITVSGISSELNFSSCFVYIVDFRRIVSPFEYTLNRNSNSMILKDEKILKKIKIGMRIKLHEFGDDILVTSIKGNEVFITARK